MSLRRVAAPLALGFLLAANAGAAVDREGRRRVLAQARTWMTRLGIAAGGDVDFAQVVLAQQTLGQAVSDYFTG